MFFLAFISLSYSASALTLDNKHVYVTVDQPENITNFTGVPMGDDFYFIGKATAPATTFKVKYKVVLKDPTNCELINPNPAEGEKTTDGGLVTPYEVQFKVNGEKKMGGNIYFIPLKVEELSPKLLDGEDKEIADSEKPLDLPKYNEMVEVILLKDGYDQNRIAHREMKVKLTGGKSLAGKKVTWTMKPWGVKEGDSHIGDWKHSKVKEHKNRFEESKDFAKYGYKLLNQESSETKIEALGEDGFTAIRVNLPPFGWNHAEVNIKIEGFKDEITMIRYVVPAVVVIDPGHGGTSSKDSIPRGPLGASSWNNAKGGYNSQNEKNYADATGVLEKDLTQEYADKLHPLLKAKTNNEFPLKSYLTKTSSDVNIGGYIRARIARDRGADLMFIIHFNASSNINARGVVMVVRTNQNINSKEDKTFSDRFLTPVAQTLFDNDTTARPVNKLRADFPKGAATTSDILGFFQDKDYHPIRSAYLEVEFIHNKGGDQLINGTATKDKVKKSVTEACRDAIIKELQLFKIQN